MPRTDKEIRAEVRRIRQLFRDTIRTKGPYMKDELGVREADTANMREGVITWTDAFAEAIMRVFDD